MKCDVRDCTKKLSSFIAIVVSLKKINTWVFFIFKGEIGLWTKTISTIINNNNNNNNNNTKTITANGNKTIIVMMMLIVTITSKLAPPSQCFV